MKMASILEEFAYGNVSPRAQALTRDARYRKAAELVERIEQNCWTGSRRTAKSSFKSIWTRGTRPIHSSSPAVSRTASD